MKVWLTQVEKRSPVLSTLRSGANAGTRVRVWLASFFPVLIALSLSNYFPSALQYPQ